MSAVPAGFALNFARKERTWGAGTYYSCKPALAAKYYYRLQPNDAAFNNYLADLKVLSGVWAQYQSTILINHTGARLAFGTHDVNSTLQVYVTCKQDCLKCT